MIYTRLELKVLPASEKGWMNSRKLKLCVYNSRVGLKTGAFPQMAVYPFKHAVAYQCSLSIFIVKRALDLWSTMATWHSILCFHRG